MKLLHTVAALALLGLSATAQAGTGSRLLASSHYVSNNGTQVCLDSQRYLYPNTTTALYNQQHTYMYSSGTMANNLEYNYTYNAADKLTFMDVKGWNGTAYNNPKSQTAYVLNPAGFTTKDSSRVWNASTSAYRDNTKNTYTLNANGAITDKVYMMWDAGAGRLLNYYHDFYTLNPQDKPLTYTHQEYDASLGWYNYNRTTFTYDASGLNIATIMGEQWDMATGSWYNVYQSQYTLNSAGAPTQVVMQNWNRTTNTWVPSGRYTYAYDAAGNDTAMTQETWDATTGTYKNSMKEVYTYNTFNQMTSDTKLYWDGSSFAVTINTTSFHYYYEPYTTSPSAVVEAGEAGEVKVYPTVCSQQVFVEGAKEGTGYQLLSANGQVVGMGKLREGQNTIETGNLSAGMYLLHMNGTKVHRIVKQ